MCISVFGSFFTEAWPKDTEVKDKSICKLKAVRITSDILIRQYESLTRIRIADGLALNLYTRTDTAFFIL